MDSAFLQALAQASPDPGGGAAAAHSGALGMALLEKVVRLEQRRQGARSHAGFPWAGLLDRVQQVAAALQRLQTEDVQAYFHLTQAKSRGDPEKLAVALQEALSCPLRIMHRAQEGLDLISQGGSRCQIHLLSDLLVACELLGGAFRGAHHIARANLFLMSVSSRRAIWAETLSRTLRAAEGVLHLVSTELLDRQACR
jgi:methenyltetrahydrofolate cyclohydrolase